MSDLTSELRRMAEDAARQARPAAVADIIRRGERRRKRTIAQKSLGGLSAAGVAAAVIFIGSAGGAPPAPAASAARGGTTLMQTTSSPAGHMKIQVKYRAQAHGRIELLSLTFSGDARKAARTPVFIVKFTPGAGALAGSAGSAGPSRRGRGPLPSHVFFFVISLRGEHHVFSGSLSADDIVATRRNGGLVDGELTHVVFGSITPIGPHKSRVHTQLREGLILF
jgi:hypothetical protein